MRIISYLPLSHAAGQFIDIFVALISGHHVFFADPSALTGSLVQTLQEVRPQAFFSVPRIWEKIHEKMMEVARGNSGVLARIGRPAVTQRAGPRTSASRARSRRSAESRPASSSSWPSGWSTSA